MQRDVTALASRSLEAITRDQWLSNPAQLYFGRCDDCKRTHDDDGRRLLVARQARSRRRQCVGCFSLDPTGPWRLH
jgi:hypothetical protein